MNSLKQDCPVCLLSMTKGFAILHDCRHIFCIECTRNFILVKSICPLGRCKIHSIKCYNDEGQELFEEDLKSFQAKVIEKRVEKLIDNQIKHHHSIFAVFQDLRKHFDSFYDFSSKVWRDFCEKVRNHCDFDVLIDEFESIKIRIYPLLEEISIDLEVIKEEDQHSLQDLGDILNIIRSFDDEERTEKLFQEAINVAILNIMQSDPFESIGRLRYLVQWLKATFDREFWNTDQITDLVNDVECYIEKLILVFRVYMNIYNWQKAVFLESERVIYGEFCALFKDSKEYCILCGQDLVVINSVRFDVCRHGLCAKCFEDFCTQMPNCPFPCVNKSFKMTSQNKAIMILKDVSAVEKILRNIHEYMTFSHHIIKYYFGLLTGFYLHLENYENKLKSNKISDDDALFSLSKITADLISKIENIALLKNYDLLRSDVSRMKLLWYSNSSTLLGMVESAVTMSSDAKNIEMVMFTEFEKIYHRVIEDSKVSSFDFVEYYGYLDQAQNLVYLSRISEKIQKIQTQLPHFGTSFTNDLFAKCSKMIEDINRYSNMLIKHIM